MGDAKLAFLRVRCRKALERNHNQAPEKILESVFNRRAGGKRTSATAVGGVC
jgi:hypothetical protein